MNYHNITHDDMKNGDGIRVVLWVSGCSHHCPDCQNPQTWDKDSGIYFDDNAMQEIVDDLKKDYVSGITFSGGDPMYPDNCSQVYEIAKIAKELNKTVWLYTGFTFNELMSNSEQRCIVKLCDVIVDGRYSKNLRDTSLKWRGSINQRVIDVPESLKHGSVVLHCS